MLKANTLQKKLALSKKQQRKKKEQNNDDNNIGNQQNGEYYIGEQILDELD